ncbi:MAG TPA: CHASE2 domain-containing protein [Treponemataceae bacterium]|nr:CHASE2 domain-containing protein [Treponemataceae bacterium]
MKKFLYLIVPVAAVLLCSLFLFTTADSKVNDLFARAIPSLKENADVLLISIDDASIEEVGLWPWTRDIMADATVFLREMGADTVAFDLSYLDKSPVKVDPAYVKEQLPTYVENGFRQIDDGVAETLDAFARGQIGERDAKARISENNQRVKNSLDTSINYVARDVDSYFGKTLRLFGKSYLTLTMITPDNIIGDDKSIKMDPKELAWLEERVALKNVTARHDTLTPECIGITPAINELLSNAMGAGFVNADADPDGYRRRLQLLIKHNGRYYGQFVLVPLLQRLGNPDIEVTNSYILLKNAHLGKKVENIKIPRAEDGSVLVRWPKKEFGDYNSIIAWELIRNNVIERQLVENLQIMRDAGFFGQYDGEPTPLDKFEQAQYLREALYDGEKPSEGITFAAYRKYRQDFVDAANGFLNGDYERAILDSLDSGDAETRAYVSETFATARKQITDIVTIRAKVAKVAVGAFCIVGTSATSTTDEGLTAWQENFPNVGVHATMANMILSREFLDDSPWYVSVIIAFALAIALGFGIKHLDTFKSLLAGIGTLAVCIGALLILFVATKRYVGVVVPFASVTVTFITLSAINFVTTIREKSFLRSAFSRYLSPAVINEIINDPSKLNLGGEKREMTAIFTDIRGFSTISEQLDPADLVNLLNMYLTEMSNIVLENRGTIDKYEGDAIIAFFGAPIHMDEHAVLACKTAIRMKKAEAELNKRIVAERLSPQPFFTRIGINTGDMIVGNMGTANKMDYTVMGNAVNLAARLEGVNKQYNTKGILVSEHTWRQTKDQFLFRRLDRVRVVGVSTPLRLYELIAENGDEATAMTESVKSWEDAIDLYEQKNFMAARKLFFRVAAGDPTDLVAPFYIKRCDEFIATPPEAKWDGVFNLTVK